eukprot:CAMPEP_0113905358 /NCGR_PEP_ID=MMETSP0780_2-20120614/23945_1 /TAXON_ID=652834 /ORGANISM="Palpitomonas bilix" /LENGTH=176 /DNA_ID=CAMNT_0000899433 /DNA_START=143 /DNA_END=670 /DNA_ORIENTATION=- /assembly_acc=CAM_ASM_000599
MEQALKEKFGSVPPEEVTDINLDFTKEPSGEVKGLEAFVNLERLSLMNCNLISLEGLSHLKKLRKLELSENRISKGLVALNKLQNLESLKLVGNKVDDFEEVKQLALLTNLSTLDMLECPLTEKEGFREKVFQLLPSLQSLNGKDLNGNDADDDEEDEEEDEDEDEDESDLEEFMK